ncbi:MAG: protein kinase [Candidatus Acidiferrales bacterium]
MPLNPGTKLGPYEIVAQLGAGGMGEVYRARDTRLDRTVAIKVLPAAVANDPERLARFEGEARVLSTLSHPNLLAIYDVGTQNGLHYVVSEFLEGETLRDRLASGPLGQRRASEYGLQLANGLAAAHEKGIIHRDLKPENIFISAGDHVKILDFGLAKQSAGASLMPGDSVTMTSAGSGSAQTAPGTVMGTVGYMSPEQVRGQVVDSRSDIFSFGAILYEMVAGRRAFKGDSAVETMNAILKEDPPDLDAAQLKVSPGMERIIRHCVEKNPANRFQSARDLGFALSALSGSSSETESTQAAALRAADAADSKRLARQVLLPWLAAALLGAVACVALYFAVKPSAPPPTRMQFAIPMPSEVSQIALSADGSMLAFVSTDADGTSRLNIQRVGFPTAVALKGTNGAQYPFWSPDNAWVAFYADSKLKKIPAAGGTPQILAPAVSPRGGSWGSRNVILFVTDAGGLIWKINPDGSGVAPVTKRFFNTTNFASHRWPQFLPDGDHFLFLATTFGSDDKASGIYLTSLKGETPKLVQLGGSTIGYADGYLYFADYRQALMSVPVDIATGKVTGEARIVAERVGFQPSTYWAAFTVSQSGTVVYYSTGGTALSVLTWYDRSGMELGRVGEPGVTNNPAISPDGQFVAADISDVKANNVDIWIYGLKAATASRFTFKPAEEVDPVWSHSGDRIAFRSDSNPAGMETKPTRGVGDTLLVAEVAGSDDVIPNSWTPDDSAILGTLQKGNGGSALVIVNPAGGRMKEFLPSQGAVTNGQISPDGKWVAYASNESGDWEIYATTFPGAQGKWQISRGTGREPRWRGDGKELYYLSPDNTLMAVSVNMAGAFATGAPVPLFEILGRAQISSTDVYTYDVTKDGQKFIVNRYVKPDHVDPLTIVLNAGAASDAGAASK